MIDRLIPIPTLTLDNIIRFYLKVTIKNETECWNWEGSIHQGIQRPVLRINSRLYIATRVAWRVYYNEDPGKFFVCHECDNPLCVNKSHLWLGTTSDNMKDMGLKGRRRGGPA